MVSATDCTSRDASGLKHAKPSHQVQSGAQNTPTRVTNYTRRDTSKLKHAKSSHQAQSGAQNTPTRVTTCTQRDTSKLKHAKPSHQAQPGPGMIMHTDQGFQYQHHSWKALLANYNVTQSMSRKRNCHDNAIAENFGLKDKKSWWRVSPSCFGGGLCGGGRARRWRRPIWG